MLFPVWNIQHGRFIASNTSLQIGASYLDQALFIDTKMIGYVATLDYKYYYRSNRKSASYLSPYIRYQNIEFQGNGDKILYKKFG